LFLLHQFCIHQGRYFSGRRGDQQAAIVQTQGGRYDVDLKKRKLTAVYWDEEAFAVRRGTWFWKVAGEIFVPYEETIADKLEVWSSFSDFPHVPCLTDFFWNRENID
jgi:hypothetical protein